MNRSLLALSLLPLFGLSNCATALRPSVQTVTVQTASANTPLTGAQCTLTNQKGNWFVITPMATTVHRGSEPLQVACTKPGYLPANYAANSSANMGTIMLQGAMLSTISGSAWSYPDVITVPMQPAPPAATP